MKEFGAHSAGANSTKNGGRNDSIRQRPLASPRLKSASCGTAVSLNDLRYEWPAGFAKFVLEAMNPNVMDLPDEGFAELSRDLGTPLRKIWAHY